ncbi:S1 family peptidase [Cellulomonas fimi]|nr:S1 family peptidase [Cellulomonas fimi]
MRHTIAIAGLATALALVPAAGWAASPDPDVDAPGPTSAPKVANGVLDAMQRDLGMSRSAAQDRLAFQAAAAETEQTLQARIGADWAGAWLDPKANVLHVAVTDAADGPAVRAAGARPVVAAHTLAELDGWRAGLDAALTPVAATVPSWYVDVTTNSVVVNATAGAVEQARSLVAAAGVPADAVRVVETTEAPRTFIDVIGGNAYYIGGGRCSVGFAVTGGFVTAGHCGRTGAATTSPSGTFAGSSFPGNDYAWVRVASGNTPVGAVNNYSGGTVAVAGSTQAAVGATVCRSGSTTGWRCGTIQAFNATVNYAEGSVSGLIRTNVCAEPGDSGGSLVAGNQAQGMTSGGSGNCSSGGTTYFQPVNEALSAYGLTLVTSGGTTPPPPTGCSGYARTYTGSLSTGRSAIQPSGSYVTVSSSGTIRLCLDGPTGSDFDLYLQKWNGSSWASVASATSSSADETISYTGTAGQYRYGVYAYAGSGSYTLGATTP